MRYRHWGGVSLAVGDVHGLPDRAECGSGGFSICEWVVGWEWVVLQWADPAPPAERAFYRLVAEPNVPAPAAAMSAAGVEAGAGEVMTIRVEYPFIDDCGCPGH